MAQSKKIATEDILVYYVKKINEAVKKTYAHKEDAIKDISFVKQIAENQDKTIMTLTFADNITKDVDVSELFKDETFENADILKKITQEVFDSFHNHDNKDILDTIDKDLIDKISHDNRETINKFSEQDGKLLFDEKEISGVSVWSDIKDKPFNKLNNEDFTVENEELKINSKGQIIQIDVLPQANIESLGKIYQYIGIDTTNYKHNYFYECVNDNGYKWKNVKVQPDTDVGNFVTSTELETHAQSNLHLTQAQRNKIANSALSSDIPTKLIDLKNDIDQVTLLNKLGVSDSGNLTYDGGLVASGVELSKDVNNIIENRIDGLYAEHQNLDAYAKTVNVITKTQTRTENAIDKCINDVHTHDNKTNVLDKLSIINNRLSFNGVDVANNIEVSKELNNGIVMKTDGVYYDDSNNHNHSNKTQLDKIGEKNGEFTYNGNTIATKISKEDGNAITQKVDGIYVSKTGVKISSDSGNIIKTSASDDGLYATVELSDKVDNNITKDNGKLYSPKIKISTATDNAISDTNGLYVKKVVPSSTEGNALTQESDGSLYVAKGAVQISAETDNAIGSKDDGLYVESFKISSDTDNQLVKKTDGYYVSKHKDMVQTVNNVKPTVNTTNINLTLDNIQNGNSRKLYELETTHLTTNTLWV